MTLPTFHAVAEGADTHTLPPKVYDAAIRAILALPRPLSVSFSGGRSSGVLLRLILDAFDGKLPEDVVALFANTGKERHETLDFVQECMVQWSVPIVWLEWCAEGEDAQETRIVSHNSASRDGEPFERLIGQRNMLPNPVTRFCTEILKIRTMARYCRDALGWKAWHVAIGYRADEKSRVAKLKSCNAKSDIWQLAFGEEFGESGTTAKKLRGNRDGHTRHAPLAEAGIHRYHVAEFWRHAEFDLRLPLTPWGTTPHGNCDLCFLKGAETIAGLVRENPDVARWWVEQETRALDAKSPAARLFRCDRPSYTEIVDLVARQADISEHWNLENMDCACTD